MTTTSPALARPTRVPPERQLYLGNLSFDTCERDLLALLRRLGLAAAAADALVVPADGGGAR